TWARIYETPYTDTGGNKVLRDIRLAVTPAAPDSVYVFAGTTPPASPATAVRVNKITSAGAPLDSFTSANIDMGQFGYNTYIAVDPANANTIYVCTRDVYRSTDGGATWASVTKNFIAPYSCNTCYKPGSSASHPDQHSFAFSPGTPSTFYVGNDGGLSKTVDGGATFASLNTTLALSQFVGYVASPTNPNLQVGGTQDNGTQARTVAGSGVGWAEFAEGDGGHPVINPVDSRAVLSTYVFGSIRRWVFNADGTPQQERGGGTSETTFGESTSNPRINFYAPFTSNGVDATVYFGTWRLFVSQNFADTVNTLAPTWNAPGGTTDLTRGGTGSNADVLNAIGVQHSAYSSSQIIYTGSSQGRVMISQDGGATWADITAGLPNRTIESITVDPSNAATAYVTLGGYGTGHVWKTVNAGQTWADLSGTTAGTKLPNVPTTALLLDPATPGVIYVGTDIGVFRSVTGGGTWETFNNGLPPIPISSFAVSAAGKIQIGTYGRGAYELNVVNTPTVQFASASQTASEASNTAESVQLALSNAANAGIGTQATTTLVITSDDVAGAANPYFDHNFFVRQHYLDFLSREPDAAGFNSWTGLLNGCAEPYNSRVAPYDPVTNPSALCDRVNVSANFFLSAEFQLKGGFVFRFYKAGLGRLPTYVEMVSDMRGVTGATSAEVFAKKASYADSFVQRADFGALYNGMTNTSFVNALMDRYGLASIRTPNPSAPDDSSDANKVTLTRADLVNRLTAATLTRAQVVRAVADSDEVSGAEFNSAFVSMQYFGYLRRDPDPSGYDTWTGFLASHPGQFRNMVFAFIASPEYKSRFGNPAHRLRATVERGGDEGGRAPQRFLDARQRAAVARGLHHLFERRAAVAKHVGDDGDVVVAARGVVHHAQQIARRVQARRLAAVGRGHGGSLRLLAHGLREIAKQSHVRAQGVGEREEEERRGERADGVGHHVRLDPAQRLQPQRHERTLDARRALYRDQVRDVARESRRR
ncbi:MAG: DUF4214 domain-containing protein, partial [Acidobacteria bacterium]|nr:DUF4214 domain-containing protein [Acidobacteriota bacterium]